MSTIISDGMARRIASEWHVPGSGLSAFSHTGLIDDRVQVEVAAEITHLESQREFLHKWTPDMAASKRDLEALAAYLEEAGHRTPVEGWSHVWE